MFDVEQIRRDFPILERKVYGKPLVYLDNAATSQKPRAVIQALVDYYEQYNSNVHRGVHALSQEATEAEERARQKIARFIKAPSMRNLIFLRNTTEAINLVAYSWGRQHVGEGDEIVLTEMEHHSNIVPWQILAAEKGATLRYIPITDEGELDLTNVNQYFTPRTKVLALTHMSNVLGTINPVAELAKLAHAVGAIVVVDGAQSAPHMPVDVRELDCDFYAFSGHKMLAPTGIGVLYGTEDLLESMPPFLGGGSMISKVHRDYSTWNDLPYKFEAGTPSIADAIAFGAAVDYLDALGMADVREHEKQMLEYAVDALTSVGGVVIHGPLDPERRGGVLSFNYRDIHPHDLGTILDSEGVAIRAGHHCCQLLMRRLDVTATARASFYVYNTTAEIDALVDALGKAKEIFSGVAVG